MLLILQTLNKFLKLPMTVDVGNSLYKYILNGRPKVISDYVFLNHRVPYDSGWFGYNRNNTAYSLSPLAIKNNLKILWH